MNTNDRARLLCLAAMSFAALLEISAPARAANLNDAILISPFRRGAHSHSRASKVAGAQNIFLDGNTWRESHSVDKEIFVADLKTGLSLQIVPVLLTSTYVYARANFVASRNPNQFGSLSLAFRF